MWWRGVNEWKILHGGENEREERLNEGGHRDWVAFLIGPAAPALLQRGVGDVIIPVAL